MLLIVVWKKVHKPFMNLLPYNNEQLNITYHITVSKYMTVGGKI